MRKWENRIEELEERVAKLEAKGGTKVKETKKAKTAKKAKETK